MCAVAVSREREEAGWPLSGRVTRRFKFISPLAHVRSHVHTQTPTLACTYHCVTHGHRMSQDGRVRALCKPEKAN